MFSYSGALLNLETLDERQSELFIKTFKKISKEGHLVKHLPITRDAPINMSGFLKTVLKNSPLCLLPILHLDFTTLLGRPQAM